VRYTAQRGTSAGANSDPGAADASQAPGFGVQFSGVSHLLLGECKVIKANAVGKPRPLHVPHPFARGVPVQGRESFEPSGPLEWFSCCGRTAGCANGGTGRYNPTGRSAFAVIDFAESAVVYAKR
jgi:hypothetical protein